MKLRLPHKFQAALLAALASVSFTTLSTGTLAVATGAALLAGQQAQAADTVFANVMNQGGDPSVAVTTTLWGDDNDVISSVSASYSVGAGAQTPSSTAYTNSILATRTNVGSNSKKGTYTYTLTFTAAEVLAYPVTLSSIDVDFVTFNGSGQGHNQASGNQINCTWTLTDTTGATLSNIDLPANGKATSTSAVYTKNADGSYTTNGFTGGTANIDFTDLALTAGKTYTLTLSVAKAAGADGFFVGIGNIALKGNVALPVSTWTGTPEANDWTSAGAWDPAWSDGNDAVFEAAGHSTVVVGSAVTARDITISDKAYTFEGSGTLTVAGAVTVNSSLVLNSAATAQAMLPKVAGAGNVTLNAVAELGSGVATTATGELTINSTRGSGAYDLKLQGGNGATHDFSHFSKVNLAEGLVIEYDAGQTTLNNVTLLGDASFSMYDMGVAGNGIWLKGATALGSHTLAFNNKSNSSSWKRKVTIDQLTGDATSKLQFLGGATGDGVGSKLYVNSLQGFSGTLHLEEKNTGNAVEATVKTGTGSAVEIAGVEFAGTGELLDLTAQTALNLGTVSVANDSEIKFHGTPTQPITIEKLAGNAANKTLKVYSADQTTSAHHIVLGAAGADYTSNLFNGTLWVTSNSNQGGSATSTVDVYVVAQDVLSATTLKTDNWDDRYNNTRISLSLGTNAKVAGINSANTGGNNTDARYTGWGTYIRSGTLTTTAPKEPSTFASTSETAYTLEITGAGTYTSNAYIMGNVNLAMSGAGSQTFSGDVTRFNGTITTTAGTLAFTNAVSAAALNGTGGTLQANGGLTVGGGTYAGTLTTSALTVNTGTLTLTGGSITNAMTVSGSGTLAINPGTSAAVTFNGTLTNAGNITLDGEGEIHIANISNFDVQKEGTEYTYSGAAGTKYAGSGFITGSNTQYYLIKGNGGTLTGDIALQGGTRVTEEVANTDYVFTVSGSTPLGTEYYVNSNLSYLNNDKDAGMDTATGFTVKEGVTFTTTGEIIHNRSMVLNEGSTLNTTATSYFDRAQINSLTLNGDATVAVAGGRIALQTGTDYRDVTLQLNGNTLTVRGNSGGYFGIVGNTTVDRGTIALQGPKFMLGHSSKGGLTANAPDTLLTLTNGSSLVPANGNRFILEGLQMAAGDTGSASIASDGATGNLTLSPDAGKSYTYKGSVKLVDLTLDGPGTQVMNVTSYDTALTSLHVNQGTLELTGADVTTGTLSGAGSLSVAGTLTVNNGSANDFTGTLALGGLTKTGAGALTIHGVAGIGSTVQVSAGSLALAAGTYDLSSLTATGGDTPVAPTESGYADMTATVQFITTSGEGNFTKESGLVFTYKGNTSDTLNDNGSVSFQGKDYTTYYLVGTGGELDLTTEQTAHPMLQTVVLSGTAGTISLNDARSLTTLTQADGSTLNLIGGGELSVASVSNNAAIAFAGGTSLTTTAALTVGSGKTFATSGAGTFKGTALNVQGGTANLGSDAVFTGNVLARSGSLNISGHTTVNGTLNGGDSSGSSAAITIAESGRLDVNTINVAWGFSSFTVNGALNVADNLQLATGNANYAIAGSGTVTTKKLTIGNTGKYTFDGTNGLKLVVGSGGIVKTGQWSPSLTLKNLTVEASENFTASMATMLNGTVKIDTNGHTVNYTAALSDSSQTGDTAGRLVKQGSGVLTLSGAASFTGGLAVEAGELALNGGSGCNVAGPVALAAGTTLTVGTGAMVDASSITAATGGTISNAGTIKFGNKTIVLEEGATLTFTGNGGVYDISSMPLTGETTIYEGGSTPDNGFAKTSGQVLLVDTSNGGTFIYNATNTEFRHGQTVCDWDATTATVTVDDEGFDYSVFHVKKGEDLVSNAMAHEDTLESILMAQGTTLIIDRDIDVSLVQLEPEVDSYTLDVQKDNTLTIARNTATSVITGEGTVVLNDVPEGTVYTASFNAASPFTGTLVFDLADTVGNHNAYVVLDDTFQGTLELRGRMNGHNMKLGGASTLRLVGDRNSNFTGIWDSGTAMHITQALEVTGDSRVELWSTNNQTTILDGTVNGGTDKVGHLSKVNNGNMNFNGAVALAEFITPGGTINFNAGANISTVNANGGNVNFKGDSTIDTLTANATATVDREATLALGTVNGTAANLVINGTVNVNGGTENALNNVTINQGGSLTFGAGTITTIAGTATISEAITNSGILNFNGPINIEGMDDSGLACYVGGQVDEVNGFKQYAANGTLTVVELQGEGAAITVKEGTVVTYRGAAGTLGSDGVFTITETHVDYSMFYVNVEGASQEKYSLAGGGEHHPASVQLADGTSFEMDAAGATLDSLIVLEEDASATLKVTKNATVTEVNAAGDLTFEGSANLTLGANTNKAYINMAGNMVIDGTTVTVNGVNNNAFTGNIEVKSGTLKLGDDPDAAETYVLGEYTTRNGARTITIDAQGTYDLNGKTDAKYFLTLNGGLLTNSGGAIGTGKAQTSGLKLLANSSIGGSNGDFHILSKGYAANNVDLQGFTLTKVGSNTVGFVKTTFDAGTLEVQGGALWFDADNNGDVTFNGPLSIVLNNAQAGNDPVLKGSGTAGDSSVNVNADVAIAATYSATTNLPLNMNGHTLSLSADGGQTQTVNGAITGTGNSNLVVGETAHNGTVVLAGANTYAGTTEVKAGTLAVSGSGSLGSGDVTVDKGATLQYDRTADQTTVANALSGEGTLKHTGSGTTEFIGNVAGFTGNIEVDAGTLNIMNIAEAANLNVADVTIGAGATLGVYNAADTTADTTHEGTLTIKGTNALTAGQGAKLNANLVMESGATLDVSGTGGAGLLMGSSVTLNPGVTLSASDMLAITGLDFMGQYTLFTGVDEFSYDGTTPTSTPIAFDSETWVKASEVFSNDQFKTGEKDYYVFYSGVQNGSNVGAVYVLQIPEPATGTLSLLALAALAARRRRK